MINGFFKYSVVIGLLLSVPSSGDDDPEPPDSEDSAVVIDDSLDMDSLSIVQDEPDTLSDSVGFKIAMPDSLADSMSVVIESDSLLDTVLTESDEPEMPLPFGVGERLEFDISFEFVLGGHAIMAVESVQQFDGYDCFVIASSARSTRTVDYFYKVRDRIESWRDVDSGFSRKFVKNLHEGKHKYTKRVEYFPETGIAYLFEKKSPKIPDTLEVIGHIQDVLGAFYELRTRPLFADSTVWIDVHDIRERYQLGVKIYGKEKIKVPAGEFNCYKIEPMLESSGLFRRKGNMEIWITDDEYRMPVLMKSWLYFGRVFAKLNRYKLAEIKKHAETE